MRIALMFLLLAGLVTGCAEQCEVCTTKDSAGNTIGTQEFCGTKSQVEDATSTHRTNQQNTYGAGATVTCTAK